MKRSQETLAGFCALLRRTGNARASAHAIGVNLQTVYRWRLSIPVFALDWELALRAFREGRVARLMAAAERQEPPAPTLSKGRPRRNSGHRRKRAARR